MKTLELPHRTGNITITYRDNTNNTLGLVLEQHNTRGFTRTRTITETTWETLHDFTAHDPNHTLTEYAHAYITYRRAEHHEENLLYTLETQKQRQENTTITLNKLQVARKTTSIRRRTYETATQTFTHALHTYQVAVQNTPVLFDLNILTDPEKARIRYLITREPHLHPTYLTSDTPQKEREGTTEWFKPEGVTLTYTFHKNTLKTRFTGENHYGNITLPHPATTYEANLFTQWVTTTRKRAYQQWFNTRYATYMLEQTLTILNTLHHTPHDTNSYTGDPKLVTYLNTRYQQLAQHQHHITQQFTQYLNSNPTVLTATELQHLHNPPQEDHTTEESVTPTPHNPATIVDRIKHYFGWF